MPKYLYSTIPNIFIFLMFFLFNIFFRAEFYFFDYDSVKNYTILQEFQQGNFQNLFYHASPLLYITLWLGNYIFSLEILLKIIHAFSLMIWAVLCKDIFLFSSEYKEIPLFFKIGFLIVFMFLLLTSYFLWGMGDYVAMESLSVLLSGFLFYFYFKSFKEAEKKNLVRDFGFFQKTAFLFGLLYTLNYKAVMLLPVFLLVELIYFLYERQIFSFKKYLISLGWAVLPVIFFIFLGVLLGVSFLQYPKTLAFTFLMSSGEKVNFGGQILGFSFFYFEWLIEYENILLFLVSVFWIFIIIILGCIFFAPLFYIILFLYSLLFLLPLMSLFYYFFPSIFGEKPSIKIFYNKFLDNDEEGLKGLKGFFKIFYTFCFSILINTKNNFVIRIAYFFALFYVLIMSFLPTAPRGLVFVYPFYFLGLVLMFFLVFKLLSEYLQKDEEMPLSIKILFTLPTFFLPILGLFLGNYYTKKPNFFSKKPNTYPQIAEYLYKNNIKEIATTQSLQLVPYMSRYGIKVYVLNHEKDFFALQEKRKKENFLPLKYILIDDYCKILNTEQNFASFYAKNALKTWDLPSLDSDLLFYEHSEFTKLNFGQTTERIQKYKYLMKAQLVSID